MGDIDHEGEIGGIVNQSVHLDWLISALDITSPMSKRTDVSRRTTERPPPEGYLAACLVRLVSLGFIDEVLPNLFGSGASRAHPDTEYRLLTLGYRFLEWCDREGTILIPDQQP